MDDVVARAKAALAGVTPGPWVHHIAPHGDDQATHAEWLAETLTGEGEQLHVLTAESTEPRFAYIVPAVTGDGPTSAINAEFIAAARSLIPELVAALEKVKALAEEWRYKGEFGWGPWQTGDGPDQEGWILDSASAQLRLAMGSEQ